MRTNQNQYQVLVHGLDRTKERSFSTHTKALEWKRELEEQGVKGVTVWKVIPKLVSDEYRAELHRMYSRNFPY